MITSECNWQNVIDAIPCLAWGVLILIAACLFIKECLPLIIKNCHERKMKEEEIELEKLRAQSNEIKANSDESLINKIAELEKKNEKQVYLLEQEQYQHNSLNNLLKEYKQLLNIIQSNMSNTKKQ